MVEPGHSMKIDLSKVPARLRSWLVAKQRSGEPLTPSEEAMLRKVLRLPMGERELAPPPAGMIAIVHESGLRLFVPEGAARR
jgi:hypothetical protein